MSALFDPVISSCAVAVIAPDGCPTGTLADNGDIFLNCRGLSSQEGVDRFCQLCEDLSLVGRIRGVDLSGAALSDSLLAHLLASTISRMNSLVELNLSYIALGHKSVPALCSIINVKIAGGTYATVLMFVFNLLVLIKVTAV